MILEITVASDSGGLDKIIKVLDEIHDIAKINYHK